MARKRTAAGFTLVELLVVIGIIAILIGILLPVLSRARDHSRSVKCLSNLRQIGMGFQMYAAEYKTHLVPGVIYQTGGGSAGGENGEPIENYATILVQLKYVPAPTQKSFTDPSAGTDSVFRCPEGLDVQHLNGVYPVGGNMFTRFNRFFWRRYSVNGFAVDTWYCANALQSGGAGNANQINWPLRRLDRNPANGAITGKLSRYGKIRRSSDMALIFDGLRVLDASIYRFSPRHKKDQYVNFLMADGHTISVHWKELPTSFPAGMAGTPAGDVAVQFLAQFYPKFRLDQP